MKLSQVVAQLERDVATANFDGDHDVAEAFEYVLVLLHNVTELGEPNHDDEG